MNRPAVLGYWRLALAAVLALSIISFALFFGAKNWRNVTSDGKAESEFSAEQGGRVLRILAYSSFLAAWGPGPTLKRMFEYERQSAKPGEKFSIEFVQADDAGLLLTKLKIFKSDVVIGLDQFTRMQAEAEGSWAPHGITSGLKFSDEKFVAFDWAPIGFVYRFGETEPPKSLEDLLSPRYRGKIALQDPRSSSPGYQFLAWIVAEKGEAQAIEYLRQLKPNVHSVSGSWSQSYGLFTRGLAKMALSYATSPLYHRYTEKDDRYRFAPFLESHPVQVEYAVIVKECQECELAKEFAKFLVSPPAQQVLMNQNWMLPINTTAAMGTPFADIIDAIGDGPTYALKIRDPMKSELKIDRRAVLKVWEDSQL